MEPHAVSGSPRTAAARRALDAGTPALAADLMFLEAWETDPVPGLGATLRIGQIRRANPALAAAIRDEIATEARLLRLGPRPAG